MGGWGGVDLVGRGVCGCGARPLVVPPLGAGRRGGEGEAGSVASKARSEVAAGTAHPGSCSPLGVLPNNASRLRASHLLRYWSQTTVGIVFSIRLHKQNHTQGDWSKQRTNLPAPGPRSAPRAPHRLRQTGVSRKCVHRIWKISTSSSDPRPSRAAGRGGTG